MIRNLDSARRKKRQFNWGMISKVVEKVIPQVQGFHYGLLKSNPKNC